MQKKYSIYSFYWVKLDICPLPFAEWDCINEPALIKLSLADWSWTYMISQFKNCPVMSLLWSFNGLNSTVWWHIATYQLGFQITSLCVILLFCFVFKFLIGMHLDTHSIVANVEWHILSFFMKCASTPKVVESFNIHVRKLEWQQSCGFPTTMLWCALGSWTFCLLHFSCFLLFILG